MIENLKNLLNTKNLLIITVSLIICYIFFKIFLYENFEEENTTVSESPNLTQETKTAQIARNKFTKEDQIQQSMNKKIHNCIYCNDNNILSKCAKYKTPLRIDRHRYVTKDQTNCIENVSSVHKRDSTITEKHGYLWTLAEPIVRKKRIEGSTFRPLPNLYKCNNPCTNIWTKIGNKLSDLSFDDDNVYGTYIPNGKKYKCTNTETNPCTGDWVEMAQPSPAPNV